MVLETSKLILRPWKETDYKSLYEYAKDPLVGPSAGWPVHTSEENSLQIIRDVLSDEETYAVTLKDDNIAIGSISLKLGENSNIHLDTSEAEIGYWLGVPYWGRGYIPEAVKELMKYAFHNLGLTTLWCGYFDGNENSKRVQEKCGFQFHHTEADRELALIHEVKTLHINRITKEEWENSFSEK